MVFPWASRSSWHFVPLRRHKLETPGRLLSWSTVVEILSHPCRIPSTQVLAVSSRQLLIAQGLGFGNYVVKRMRVASANNVNGKAAGLPVQGWFVVMPGKEWRKKNRAIEHAKNIVTSFAIRKQRKNKETIFFPSPEIEPHKEDVSPALFLCCKIKGLHHVDKENW